MADEDLPIDDEEIGLRPAVPDYDRPCPLCGAKPNEPERPVLRCPRCAKNVPQELIRREDDGTPLHATCGAK